MRRPSGGCRERIGSNAPLTRRCKSDKQVTNGMVGSQSQGPKGDTPETTIPLCNLGEGGACWTTYPSGSASRACSQVIRTTERYLNGASGKNLVLLQVSCSTLDRITWHGIDAKRREVNLADAPLKLTEKLLGEPRRNLSELPVRDRPIGGLCAERGSGPVGLDGVTPVQGVRESRAQGEEV
jgi:hypothetical protein